MGDVLRLACGGDASYLVHNAAMLASVLEHRGDFEVEVFHLHGPPLPEAEAKLLEGMVERAGGTLRCLPVTSETAASLPGSRHLTAATWYRIFLPELLPDVDRILYLDADVVVRESLAPLWSTDLEGNTVAAVTNVFEPWNFGWPEHGLGLRTPYFNAGVLLMDLERMRRDDVAAKILEHAAANEGRMPFGDQDPLNAVLAESRKSLHPRWNVQNAVVHFEWAADVFEPPELAEARAHPAIRHFEGPASNKPWHFLCERDGREEYFRYRAMTPWPKVQIEGRTPANLARRAVRPARPLYAPLVRAARHQKRTK